MINTIYQIKRELRSALSGIGLTLYAELKPEKEDGDCIVITHIPIKKNNVNSINDVIIFLYLTKSVGYARITDIETYSEAIWDVLGSFKAANGCIFFNEEVEPETDNLDDSYTVTKYVLRTINS